MKIGMKLKKRRIECSYSISDVASILGVNVDEIRDIENDVKEPSLEQLSILSKIYMTSIDDLCLPISRQNYYVKNKRFNKIELYMSFVFIIATILNFILLAVPFTAVLRENGYEYISGYNQIFGGVNPLYLSIFILNIVLFSASIIFIFFDNKFSKYIEFALIFALLICILLRFIDILSFSNYIVEGIITILVTNVTALVINIGLMIFRHLTK